MPTYRYESRSAAGKMQVLEGNAAALRRDNGKLAGLDVRTADGREHHVDTIIYGTEDRPPAPVVLMLAFQQVMVLSILLLARDEEDGSALTDPQVRDEVMTLLLAGHETTANALTWAWYELCRNPELACEVTLQPIDEFGFDAAILFSDILITLPPMGVDVAFPESGPKIGNPVRTRAAMKSPVIMSE